MSFWDNVKKFAAPYDDDEYDEYEDEMDEYVDEEEEEPAPAPAPRARRRPNFGSSAATAPASEPMPDFTPAASSAPAAPAAPSTTNAFSGSVLNMHSNRQEVVLFHAKTFDDVTKAADELRSKRAVILNMENVDKALTRRVVDFLSGSVYALDGKVRKIAQSTYLFCPHGMDIVGDLDSYQSEVESYV